MTTGAAIPTLLVIDDEESVRYSFRRAFEGDKARVVTARTAKEGLEQLHAEQPDAVVLDLQLPDRSGLDLLADLQAVDSRRPIIMITAHGSTDTAIEAMKRGVFDYLVKPVDLERLTQILDRAFHAARLMRSPALLPAEDGGDRIVGRSSIIQEMCKAIGRTAPQDVNVLILGESGTGKELVARALYQHSRRAERPFLAVNCAALPESILESELFGHEQGAFTGAVRRRIGKFEQCDGGTLFLDEIGDMTPVLQAKMLRVLQDQRFERLGGNETVTTNVRVLAATNRNLEALIEEGHFRLDLYYRLKVVTIQVPALRDRRDDIAELAHYFLFRFNRELARDLHGFAPETLKIFQEYAWPGNVRELQSAVKQAILNTSGQIIHPEFLPAELRCALSKPPVPTEAVAGINLESLVQSLLERGETDVHAKVVQAVERVLLTRVLRQTHGHLSQASEILGLNRATLRHKLRELGLTLDKTVVEGDQD